MVAQVSGLNPYLLTNAPGFFSTTTVGLVQGNAFPDPATRWALKGGTLAQAETIPMWGGVGVYADIGGASGGPVGPLGTILGRATALSGGSTPLAGFSVFDQNYAAIQTPQSPVPTSGSGMEVNWYALGSNARIPVQADASLLSLQGSPISTDVSWDFVNQKLMPYLGSTAISSGTYNSTTGVVVLTFASAPGFNVGDTAIVSGATGTGSFASINGTVQITAVSGATISYVIATGLTLTITGANVASSGILPVKLLDVQASNCMVVSYNATTNFATWNTNGAAAVIQI